MFDDYGTINVNGQNVAIEKLSVDELEKYLMMLNNKEKIVINKQNEYLSQLIG